MIGTNTVIAKVYENDKLVGIFPRTTKITASLDNLLSLADQNTRIDFEVKQKYFTSHQIDKDPILVSLFEHTTKMLKVKTFESELPDVLIKLEQGVFTEEVIREAQNLLEFGAVRTAEKITDPQTGKSTWQTQIYGLDCMNALFKRPNDPMGNGYYDKVPLLTHGWTKEMFDARGIRFIPGSFARGGSYIGYGVTLMPGSIVNSGAHVGDGSIIGDEKPQGQDIMNDGGARIASGAQVGKGVKMGAGSGLEGVLQPKGYLPTI